MLNPTHALHVRSVMSRRDAIRLAGVAAMASLVPTISACRRGPMMGDEVGQGTNLYTSLDTQVIDQVISTIDSITTGSPLRVRVIGDTEATKATGLVQRIIDERARPGCDVWFSSEILGTLRLASMGLLEPLGDIAAPIAPAPGAAPVPWPIVGPDAAYLAVAQRPRVIAWSSRRLGTAANKPAPASLQALVQDPSIRVAIADPRFGTTRGDLAALALAWGESALTDWLTRLVRNGLRVVPGNAAVVRAINTSEADCGLTDYDDLFAAISNAWPVAGHAAIDEASPERGCVYTPATLAIIRNAPNPDRARRLARAMSSPEVQTVLAQGPMRMNPVGRTLENLPADLPTYPAAKVNWNELLAGEQIAMRAWDKAQRAG